MTFVAPSNLSTRAKTLIGIIIAGASAMQIDQVKNFVTPYIANHPKLTSIAGAIFTIASIIQNPMVQKALGIENKKHVEEMPDGKKIVTDTSTVVALEPNTTASGYISTTKP